MARGDFVPTTWINGAAPGISAAQLQRIETQVDLLDAVWDVWEVGTGYFESKTVSGPRLIHAGSASTPTYSFNGDPDTGMYRIDINRVGIATFGVERLRIDGDALLVGGIANGHALIQTTNSVSAPAFSFYNDGDTGMYWLSADVFGWAAGGARRMALSGTGLSIGDGSTVGLARIKADDAGSAAAPAYHFVSDEDTGMYRVGIDIIGFSAGGARRLSVSTGAVVVGDGATTGTPQMKSDAVGTAAAPAYAFYSASDMGMYRYVSGTTRIGWSIGGTERMILTSGPALAPGSDNAVALGASSLRWSVVYAATGTINTSDERSKDSIRNLDEGLAAQLVEQINPIQFTFKDGTRQHWGFSAQQTAESLRAVGLDPSDYGVYIDPQAKPELLEWPLDAGGDEVKSNVPLGIRPDELVPVLWKSHQTLTGMVNTHDERIGNHDERINSLRQFVNDQQGVIDHYAERLHDLERRIPTMEATDG